MVQQQAMMTERCEDIIRPCLISQFLLQGREGVSPTDCLYKLLQNIYIYIKYIDSKVISYKK